MKKIILLLTMSAMGFSGSYAQNMPCNNTCKVSKLVEEGVFLGVQINTGANGTNARIVRVFEKTAAEKSGLLVNNTITKVNNEVILGKDHLVQVIQSYKPGDKVKISYVDNNNAEKSMKVRLGAKKMTIVEESICCDDVNKNLVLSEGLNLFPNPASDVVSVATSNEIEGEVEVFVYNFEGREMLYDNFLNKGKVNQKVDIKHLPQGEYVVRLSSGAINYTAKMIVVR